MDKIIRDVVEKNGRAVRKAVAKAAADIPAEIIRNVLISRFDKGEGPIIGIIRRRLR